MRTRMAMLLAFVALAASVAAFGRAPGTARACTGPGPSAVLPYAPRVMEARIVGLDPLPWDGPVTPGPRPYRVTVDVSRAYRGVTVGERLTATMDVLPPGYPQPCPSPELKADSLGKWFIGAFEPGAGNAAITWLGLDPSGPEWERATAVAEVMTGSNPARPSLRTEPAEPVCGERVRLIGERFAPGTYAVRGGLWYPRRVEGVVHVGGDGTFAVETRVAVSACRLPGWAPFADYFVQSLVRAEDDPLGGIAAVAAPPIHGQAASARPYPELSIATPFFCDGGIEITGKGFEPGEAIALRMGGAEAWATTVTAGPDGSFAFGIPVPPGGCVNQGNVIVMAAQAAFTELPFEERMLTIASAWAEPGSAPRPAPGPPNAGSGHDGGNPWPEAALLAAGAGTLAAFAASRRRGERLPPG
ncbi:MAG: hypothetical protein IT302_01440 [Dehalococcoidia bacterium]|nr:hypothetical protein [Dehalococcoidia bacterium]